MINQRNIKNLKSKAGLLILSIEPYLYFIPSIFLYIGLYFVKKITGKRIVFCQIELSRIGHLAANTELFLRRLKYTNYYDKKNNIYIGLCNHFPVSNRQLLNMYKREFFIIEIRILKGLFNTWIKRTEFFHILPLNSNEYYEFDTFKPILSFTKEEEEKGKQLLAEMGIGENDWFVCFHSRDTAYLNCLRLDFRNSDICNYLKAMEYLAEKGGFAIRMGSVVEKSLPIERHPRIIDYASDFRSDFMDIYISAHCKFFVGDSCGLHQVAQIFNVPVAWANVIPMKYPPLTKVDRYIPKKLWSVKRGRQITFKEIIEEGIIDYFSTEEYENANITIIENTPDEILDLVIEMNETLEGDYKYGTEDNKLQNKYKLLFPKNSHCYGCPARVGAKYLRDNRDLLSPEKIHL